MKKDNALKLCQATHWSCDDFLLKWPSETGTADRYVLPILFGAYLYVRPPTAAFNCNCIIPQLCVCRTETTRSKSSKTSFAWDAYFEISNLKHSDWIEYQILYYSTEYLKLSNFRTCLAFRQPPFFRACAIFSIIYTLVSVGLHLLPLIARPDLFCPLA